MKAHIVIGLGYGDEGKGITTDYLVSKADKPVVIRFSGGQQAGHTVMLNDGDTIIKHIFSNFGSGTLRGVPTYFTEHTTFYPTTILREEEILHDKGFVSPKLILHPLAKMTTPWDVFMNRRDQENLEHGSCGLGVGKTMERNEGPFKLYAVDLLNPKILFLKVNNIIKEYMKIYPEHILSSSETTDIADFWHAIHNRDWKVENYNWLYNFNTLIFEGSQGVMLDMDHGIHPHTTWANTTSKNAHAVLDMLDPDGIDYQRHMFYVTRSYSTRHGADPNYQHQPLALVNTEEEINVNNKWQKEFKTAPLDEELLNYALEVDRIYSQNEERTLVITCNDQYTENISEVFKKKFNRILYSHSSESKDFTFTKHMGNPAQERSADTKTVEETTTTTTETHTEETPATETLGDGAGAEGNV